MKIKLLTATLCLLALAFAAAGQEPRPAGEQKKEESTKGEVRKENAKSDQKLTARDYEDLLDKLKKGDTDVDYARLRLAYTETKDYAPYGGGELRNQMMTALGEKNYKEALKRAEEMLKTNYVDLYAHFTATAAYQNLGKEKESKFHKAVFDGLMNAITQNDGLTAKTAMISIGISEQYFVMGYMGFEKQSKGLTREDGSIFDVHTSYNSETKETRKFYFNIDKVFGKF
jgi:hypothetical protein